jgi:hypothetical protein
MTEPGMLFWCLIIERDSLPFMRGLHDLRGASMNREALRQAWQYQNSSDKLFWSEEDLLGKE